MMVKYLSMLITCLVFGQQPSLLNRDDKINKISLLTFSDQMLFDRTEYATKQFKKTKYFEGDIAVFYKIVNVIVKSEINLSNLQFYPKDSLFSNLYLLEVPKNKMMTTNMELNLISKCSKNVIYSSIFRCCHLDKKDKGFRSYSWQDNTLFEKIDEILDLSKIKYLFHINGMPMGVEFIITDKDEVYVFMRNNKKILTLYDFHVSYINGEIKRENVIGPEWLYDIFR